MGIARWSTDEQVINFDEQYGIEYPSASGTEGGGNQIFQMYNIGGTPTLYLIHPDRSVLVKQIYPPTTENIVDSLTKYGCITQACSNSGIDDFGIITDIKLYPNPATTRTQLEIEIIKDRKLSIELVNLMGDVVLKSLEQNFQPGRHTISLKLDNIQKGIYFLSVLNEETVYSTRKLLIN